MRVYVVGASGFVGRHVTAVLSAAGHELVTGPRVDLAQATSAADWLPRLQGVDAVVNAVGVLRDTRRRPIWPTHAEGPKALFDACAQAGVRRVVQVSALGVDQSETVYARSKRAADEHLWSLVRAGRLDAVVVRPSVVVGPGGASTAMFLTLAKLPAVILPGPVARGLAQPVHVNDVADAVRRALEGEADALVAGGANALPVVGPEVFTLRQLIAGWRAALGRSPALVALLPDALSRLSARMGDQVPAVPWCTEAMALLAQPNTGDVQPLTRLLGRAPVSVREWPKELRG